MYILSKLSPSQSSCKAIRIIAIFCLLSATQSCALHSSTHAIDQPVTTKSSLPDATRGNNDPAQIVRGFYQQQLLDVLWSEDPGKRSTLLSNRLAVLFKANQHKHGNITITFDPIVNGQDALITDLVVHPAVIHRNRAHVHVYFRNFEQDNSMVYNFIREHDNWKLDEIAAIGGEVRWLLSDVLENP